MDELSSSNALLGDPAALRRRLAEDGYLFFRDLLPAAEMHAAADGVVTALRRGGWIDDGGLASADRRALNTAEALGDPAFRAAITSRGFNRIPYLAELRRTIRTVLGPQSFSYPSKVLRAIYPERPPGVARGRYELRRQGLQAARVGCIEAPRSRTVDVEHAEQLIRGDERYDNLGARGGIAGDMSRKLVHVGHQQSAPPCRGRAAHAAAQCDAHAGGLALEGADHQLATLEEIKPGPVEVGQGIEDECAGVGRVGNEVAFTGEQSCQLRAQPGVVPGLVLEVVAFGRVAHAGIVTLYI